MATPFNEDTWKQRAGRRRERAQRAGRLPSKVQSQWEDDLRYIRGLRVVVEWCEARSLVVEFRKQHGGVYYTSQGRITISDGASPKLQLHYLLHECGHHLIGPKRRGERFGMGYGLDDERLLRSPHHKLDVIEEEFEAWHRGWNLGRKLRIVTRKDRVCYDDTRIKMLRTYIDWASKSWGTTEEPKIG